jgi:parvulin-like peptidyl-prolyl isomerase
MISRRCSLLLIAVTAALAGCAVDDSVVAEVAGREIDVGQVQDYLTATTGMPWQTVSRRAAEGLLDQFLDQEVMVAASEELEHDQISTDPAVRSATVRRLIGAVCGAPPSPSEEDVDREVERRLQTVRPARARVRQLLIDTEDQARQAHDRLESGEPFLEVSRAVSTAPNAESGGDVGTIARGTLPAGLDEVVFALSEGEFSVPVASPAGYHIFQVLEVVPEGPPSRDEIEPVVRRELADELSRDFTRRCVAQTADAVGVEMYEDHLWFAYRGRYGEAKDDE